MVLSLEILKMSEEDPDYCHSIVLPNGRDILIKNRYLQLVENLLDILSEM